MPMMCLRTFSPEFVVYRLSLVRKCSVTVSASLLRYNSTLVSTPLLQDLRSASISESKHWLSSIRKFYMGSSLSRGRKYTPSKNEPGTMHPRSHANCGESRFSCVRVPSTTTEYVEGIVCHENEIGENRMKVFDLGNEGGKVLLVKQDGKISALGTKCTHYGAPLVSGHLGKGRIRCQWHGACFNILNGDIEDFPGMDSLPCYEVKVRNGKVFVRAEKQMLMSNKYVKPFISTVHPHKSTFLVVGGGPAGANCVETLRQQGYTGRLIFVLAEKYLPYDRIKLSKSLDVEIEKILLRPMSFYQERNIEVMLNTKLKKLDTVINCAYLSNDSCIEFDKVFIATGASPRFLDVPGKNLKNIFVLRTIDDARGIVNALTKTSNVVILGNSFIGMEAAAFCADKVKSVVVIGRDIPFKAVFGAEIGSQILKLYQDKNVNFWLNDTIVKFEGKNGELTKVVLKNGSTLEADICLIGIGTVSNTSFLDQNDLHKDGSIEVNEFLQTKYQNVFAGGDVAIAPVLGQKAKIGHWGLANYHGHIAAFNMLERRKPIKTVPFFWTVLFGKGFRYTGFTRSFDEVVIDGSVEDFKFIAFYCKNDVVVAVTTINRDPLAAKFAEDLYEGKVLHKQEIKDWLL